MKALLISIHPQWVELILNFIKKDEIRKGTAIGKAINRLIKEQGVAPTFIYCTKGNKHECLEYADNPNPNKEGKWVITSGYPYANGKVVARFNVTAEEINATNLEKFIKDSYLTIRELEEYLWSNILSGTAIHITKLEIFTKPREISEFKVRKYEYNTPRYKVYTDYPLTRAPQSWCYVEV